MEVMYPDCGKPMEAGRIFGKIPLLWSPKDKKFTLIKGKEDVSLIKGRFPEAWICKDCQTVIFHYGEAVRAPSAKSSE